MVTWKPILFLAAALSIGGYTASVLRSPQGIPSMQENQRRIREAETANEELKKRIENLKHENEKLQGDAEERDRAVRKHTNKQKPGDTTFMLPDDAEPEVSPKSAEPKR